MITISFEKCIFGLGYSNPLFQNYFSKIPSEWVLAARSDSSTSLGLTHVWEVLNSTSPDCLPSLSFKWSTRPQSLFLPSPLPCVLCPLPLHPPPPPPAATAPTQMRRCHFTSISCPGFCLWKEKAEDAWSNTLTSDTKGWCGLRVTTGLRGGHHMHTRGRHRACGALVELRCQCQSAALEASGMSTG